MAAVANKPAFAYTIAGSEATGGAGIQADLKVFHELGTFGLGTLTCIVSFDPENNWNHRFFPVPEEIVAQQIQVALADYPLDTLKIGMLGTPGTIEVVAESISKHPWKHVVVDPVLICKGQEAGHALDTDNALREKILPLATVVTPNLFETKVLAGVEEITTVEQLKDAAKRIGDLGVPYVVAKGGVELPGDEAIDVVYDGKEIYETRRPKIGQERVSGAGCSLAAGIAAELAKGNSVLEAVETARNLVTAGIAARVSGNTPFDAIWQGAYRFSEK